MANTFAEEIKIIVGDDEAKGGLGAAPSKDAIPGVRGVGYAQPNQAAAGLIGSPNETIAPIPTGGTTDDGQDHSEDSTVVSEEGVFGVDGEGTAEAAVFDTEEPENGVYNTRAGTHTADEIMVDEEGPQPISSDSLGTTGVVDLKGGMLKQLEALDCATGKTIKIRTDGIFVPPDSVLDDDGEILLNEWEEASTPPPLVGFVQGKYWEGSGSGNPTAEQASTPYAVALAMLDYLNANPAGGDTPGSGVLDLIGQQSSILYEPQYTFDNAGSPRTFNLTITQIDCLATPPDSATSCPIEAPVADAWPDTGDEFVLSNQRGVFVENEFDSQVPPEFTPDTSRVNFCFGSGQFGQLIAAKNGGTMLVETEGANGDIKGGSIVRVFDREGRAIAYTDTNGASAYAVR